MTEKYLDVGKGSNIPCNALAARFNTIESRGFDFKNLRKDSKNSKPHIAINDDRHIALSEIEVTKKNLRQKVAYKLMIDLACRP